jgi:hypothetical protein
MLKANCPSCEEAIKLFKGSKIGQKLTCPHCDEWLVVMQLNPVALGSSDGSNWADNAIWNSKRRRNGKENGFSSPRMRWIEDTKWEAAGDDPAGGKDKKRKRRKQGRRIAPRWSEDLEDDHADLEKTAIWHKKHRPRKDRLSGHGWDELQVY